MFSLFIGRRAVSVRRSWVLLFVLGCLFAGPVQAALGPLANLPSVVESVDESYRRLLSEAPVLRSFEDAAPVFRTMLYLEAVLGKNGRMSERAHAPAAKKGIPLHRYLLWHDDLLGLLSEAGSSGKTILSGSDAVRTYAAVLVAAEAFELPPELLLCLFLQESRLRSQAVSPTGAEGVGQLTKIGIHQVEQLLERSDARSDRLFRYEEKLRDLYSDPGNRILFHAIFPDFRIPRIERINGAERSGVSEQLLRRVFLLLSHDAPDLLADRVKLRQLCQRLRQGKSIAPRYGKVVKAYRIAAEETYGQRTGYTFNPETNVAYSALLFRYYVRYPWKVGERRLKLPRPVRRGLAVLAYNQGPGTVLRILGRLSSGNLQGLETVRPREWLDLFSQQILPELMSRGSGPRSTQLYLHFKAVMECAAASGDNAGA